MLRGSSGLKRSGSLDILCFHCSVAACNSSKLKVTDSGQAGFSLHYCYVKITIFHPVVSKKKLCFYLKPVNREYPYSSVGMRAAAIIAMCRTLCPYSPAHKILGNRTTYFSTTHACFQISRKLAKFDSSLFLCKRYPWLQEYKKNFFSFCYDNDSTTIGVLIAYLLDNHQPLRLY